MYLYKMVLIFIWMRVGTSEFKNPPILGFASLCISQFSVYKIENYFLVYFYVDFNNYVTLAIYVSTSMQYMYI